MDPNYALATENERREVDAAITREAQVHNLGVIILKPLVLKDSGNLSDETADIMKSVREGETHLEFEQARKEMEGLVEIEKQLNQ